MKNCLTRFTGALALALALMLTSSSAKAWSHYGVAWGTNTTVTWSIATGTTIDLTTQELDGSFLDDGNVTTRTTSGITQVTTLNAGVTTAINNAFSAWSTALTSAGANVTFTQVTESGNLAFNSASENPGTNVGLIRIWAYDFQGNAAPASGFAFIPNQDEIGGDIFIDAADFVTYNADNFYTIFLHELGHALGLGHSGVGGAIMESNPGVVALGSAVNADDSAGIADLYSGAYSDLDAGSGPTPVIGGFAGPGTPEPATWVLGFMAAACAMVMWLRSRASSSC